MPSTTEDGSSVTDIPSRPRRSKKKVPENKQPSNEQQRDVIAHLSAWAGLGTSVIHPMQGIDGEVQVIALAMRAEGQVMLRLDHVPPFRGVPFRTALRGAFPDFPCSIYLVTRQWVPLSKPLKDVPPRKPRSPKKV